MVMIPERGPTTAALTNRTMRTAVVKLGGSSAKGSRVRSSGEMATTCVNADASDSAMMTVMAHPTGRSCVTRWRVLTGRLMTLTAVSSRPGGRKMSGLTPPWFLQRGVAGLDVDGSSALGPSLFRRAL